MTTIHGQPSYVIRTPEVELAVTELGGHMAPVTFYRGAAKPVQPYHISPWQDERPKSVPVPVLAGVARAARERRGPVGSAIYLGPHRRSNGGCLRAGHSLGFTRRRGERPYYVPVHRYLHSILAVGDCGSFSHPRLDL